MKAIWHSNAPFTPTGYGQQTALFAPYLAKRYDLAISAFYGLTGGSIRWQDIPILPGLGVDFGDQTLPEHALRYFGGDPHDGLVLMLADVWPFDPEIGHKINLACWTPVDHDPIPPKVAEFFVNSGAVPIAMSRFGERQLGLLDPLYVPHGVDANVYKPLSDEMKLSAFPKGAFVVGMVAANKGHPSRKAFSLALHAFARLSEKHDNAYLYLHTVMDPTISAGESIASMLQLFGVPDDRVRQADQYALLYNPYKPADMAKIYSALDVLLNPSFGEGFGIPIVEAQSCGVPVVVTDFSAMPELVGGGWKVGHHPYWSGLNSLQAIPDEDEIYDALEECYSLTQAAREKLSQDCRRHALRYDVRRVWDRYWVPALRAVEQRFEKVKPITIPSRLEKAA